MLPKRPNYHHSVPLPAGSSSQSCIQLLGLLATWQPEAFLGHHSELRMCANRKALLVLDEAERLVWNLIPRPIHSPRTPVRNSTQMYLFKKRRKKSALMCNVQCNEDELRACRVFFGKDQMSARPLTFPAPAQRASP